MYQSTQFSKRYLGVPEFHEERVAVTNALIKENKIEYLVDYGYNPFIYEDFDIPREAITVIEQHPVANADYKVIHGDFNRLALDYIKENTLFTYFIFKRFHKQRLNQFIKNEFKKNNIMLVWDRRVGQRYETIKLG